MSNSRAVKQLKKLPLLQSIDAQLWETLTPHITLRDLAEGETLFSAGLESQNLYLIVDGELGLYAPCPSSGETFYLQSRQKGDTAGDFAVLNGGEHLVNAIAIKKTRVAQFPRYAFDRLTDIDSSILKHVYAVAAELSRRVTLSGAYLELFGDVSHATMDALLDKTVINHYHSGQTVFEDGDTPDGLHVMLSGKLIVQTIGQNGDVRHIAEVQAPETVGELALLVGSNRGATVVAARESTVALLGQDDFHSLIAPKAEMMMGLTRLLVQRHLANVRQENQRTADRNFVVVPLDSRLPLRRFVHQLKQSMREIGSTFLLDSRSFDTLYGRTGVSQTPFDDAFNSAIAEWLDDKENRFDALIYVADKQWNAWTKRCVNRADRIVLLASAKPSNDPSPREIEIELSRFFENSRIRPNVDLVLLHPTRTIEPKGTAPWLRPRILDAYHHIRLNDPAHFGRLARRLRNVARGLVFSGGGARGYAHLGVQKLIEEQDIHIDYIGGSSMGGLLGASMAMGKSSSQIMQLSERFANKKALYDYTLPLTSLMKSAKLTRFCKEVYGDTRIEDLWIPFFCISSNLADGQEVVHDRGRLWEVVRSTISLPGVFSPVPSLNGDLLVDGAVLNTFPVDIMQRRLGGRGYIIGVNVSQIPEQFNYYDFGPSLSGWRVLLSRINPFEQSISIPRIAETLLRATDIKSIERLNEARRSLEILVEPNVRSISLLDFKSFAAISELGYTEAQKVFSRHGLCKTDLEKTESSRLRSHG
ncbi:MAG: cyclic nucleotide-binding domain-containing protein [Granulosicoccus sp.]|nr:cyclic nucleotide-binding domain-containing protein [Granulosicoccus sp.]